MISKKTYSAINYLVWSGFFLGVVPFQWDKQKKRLRLTHSFQRLVHISFALGHIGGRIIALLYFFISITVRDIPTWEIIFGMFLMSLLSFTAFIQTTILLIAPEIEVLVNSSLVFQDKIVKLFKIREKRSDRQGLDRIVQIALYAPTVLTLVAGPGIYFLLKYESLKLLSPFKFLRRILVALGVPAVYEALTVGAMYAIIYDLKSIFTLMFVAYLFVTCTSNLMGFFMCPKSGITRVMKRLIQVNLRAYQILHTVAVETTFTVIPTGVFACVTLMITAFYSCFVLYEIQNYFLASVLFLAGFITSFAGKLLNSLATKTTTIISLIPASFKKYDKGFSRRDKLFFNSCPPLRWKVGHFIEVTNSTYPIIMKDVVLAAVINLLLTFRPAASQRVYDLTT